MSGSGSLRGKDPATGDVLEVRFHDGRISSVTNATGPCDTFISPGLIDLQVNGAFGLDLNAPPLTAQTVSELTFALMRRGTTTFLPTLITASEKNIIAALAAVAEARDADPLVAAAIPYVHVEGPWIAAGDGPRGAHPSEHVKPPDMGEFQRWQNESGNLVGMVTMSPHFTNSTQIISQLVEAGVVVALGHTDASREQLNAAADAGARISTHLGNGISSQLPRHPNPIWTQLANDRLMASFIADGFHLEPEVLKTMIRAKGLHMSMLVSDSAAPTGLAPGRYSASIGGDVHLSAEGRLSLSDPAYLAGSAKLLSQCVAHFASMSGFDLHEALQLATRQPGQLVGARGIMQVGARADLFTFEWQPGAKDLEPCEIVIAGDAL